MNHLVVGLMLLAVAVVLSWGLGRQFPSSRRLDQVWGEGWDACELALTDDQACHDDLVAAALSTGRGAADDGPAPLPAPSMIYREPPEDLAEDDDDATADWLHTMRTELAAETERPATDTEQFRAVLGRADGLERQALLTWDSARRFERSRPQYLREAGVSEKRIRQLLGAE